LSNLSVSAGKKASLLDFFFTITLSIAGFLYLILAAYSHDPLWFWPKFSSLPAQIIIRCYGSERALDGNSKEGQEISALVNDQISGDKRFDPLSLSDQTYTYYQVDPGVVTLELVYAEPIRIHFPNMFFTNITSLLIPLDGRYANSSTVFGLIDGVPAGGSFHTKSNQAIVDYLDRAALCMKP
jgi:hypothetical protein